MKFNNDVPDDSSEAASFTEKRLPNVVLIVTDQQRADSLACLGHPGIETPHLDALRAAGTAFERCYVASPVCMPNRASIMTGRMPSLHRVRMNGIPLSLQENTFVELLRLRGYKTALIGKSHLQNMIDLPPYASLHPKGVGTWMPPREAAEAVKRRVGDDYRQELPERWSADASLAMTTPFYGFDDVLLCTGHGDMMGGHYYQWLRSLGHDPQTMRGPEHALPQSLTCPQAWRTSVPEELYPTRYIENETVDYIRKHASCGSGNPFMVAMSFPDPHHPFTPPGRYWDMYDPDAQILPPSFDCDDGVLPQVKWAREQRNKPPGASTKGYSAFSVNEREAREAMALTSGMISMIDAAVGKVVATLRETGQLDNTLIIFTSDHGDYLGDYGLLLKGPLHSHGLIRVPLIWYDGSTLQEGATSRTMCSSIDIGATILDRVGISPYNGMQGRSLLPAIAQCDYLQTRSILIEEDALAAHFGFVEPPRIRTLVTERYRMSMYGRTGHGELFDLINDPYELENRWACASHESIRINLTEELALTQMELADTSPWPVYLA